MCRSLARGMSRERRAQEMEKGGEGLPVTVRKESKETISGPLSLLSSSIVSVAAAYISSMRG
jgi:hypothetical protein